MRKVLLTERYNGQGWNHQDLYATYEKEISPDYVLIEGGEHILSPHFVEQLRTQKGFDELYCHFL